MTSKHELLLTDVGRELGVRQMLNVQQAVKGVFVAWLALTGATHRAHADQGGWCTPAGCYVWADPYWDSQAGGGSGGGGSGNPNCTEDCGPPPGGPPPPHVLPPAQLPNLTKLLCATNTFGTQHPIYPVIEANEYAFVNAAGTFAYSETTPTMPAGFERLYGLTAIGNQWVGGGWSAVYAGGMVPFSGQFVYIDPSTNQQVTISTSFTGFEWALLTIVHEVAHQHGLGDSLANEMFGDGLGYKAVQRYRAGNSCR